MKESYKTKLTRSIMKSVGHVGWEMKNLQRSDAQKVEEKREVRDNENAMGGLP